MKAALRILAFVLFTILSFQAMSQDPGGNPDGPPPAVPFDDYLLPILLVAGLGLVFLLFRKMKVKKA